MKLNKITAAFALTAFAAAAAPYEALALHIAQAVGVSKAVADEAKGARESVWSLFRSAVRIGAELKDSKGRPVPHSVEALRSGLEYACDLNGIPAGTVRGYAATVEALYRDVLRFSKASKGKPQIGLTLAEVEAMSVADARKRYKAAPSEADAARAELAELVSKWEAAEIRLLIELAITAAKPAQASGEQMGEAANG